MTKWTLPEGRCPIISASEGALKRTAEFAGTWESDLAKEILYLRARVAELEAEWDEAMCEAVYLAKTFHRRFYQTQAPQWEPLNDVAGVISQIDNMAAGIAARAEAAEAKVKALVEALRPFANAFETAMNEGGARSLGLMEANAYYHLQSGSFRAALAVIQEDKT